MAQSQALVKASDLAFTYLDLKPDGEPPAEQVVLLYRYTIKAQPTVNKGLSQLSQLILKQYFDFSKTAKA